MFHRRTLLCSAAIAALGLTSGARGAETGPSTLRGVRWPRWLQKVGEELSRRYHAKVFVDPALADLRVLWAFNGEPPLEEILSRLAELTDSRVTVRTSESGSRRFSLDRPVRTTQLEEAWRTAALSRSVAELVRASSDYEAGKLNPASFSPNVRVYLEPPISRGPLLKYLARLTPDQFGHLFQGEEVGFA